MILCQEIRSGCCYTCVVSMGSRVRAEAGPVKPTVDLASQVSRRRYADKSMRTALQAKVVLIVAVGHLAIVAARADYIMPPFPTVVVEATAIVDATVVEVLERGRVRIEVHEVLKGSKPPLALSSAWLTCLGVDLSRRLGVGQRYVLVLHDKSLYEENTFYEVRDGTSGPQCNCWDGSDDSSRRWMPVSEFKRLLDGSQGS